MAIYDQEQQPQGRGYGPILLGLAIAIFGFFMYMSHTEENPVTGEKQHLSLTPAEEIRLGLESAPQMAQEMGGEISSSDPRAQRLQAIGENIVAHSDAHKGPWKFQFHLLADDKVINAFALPGGQIFITLGLYDKLQTDDQLAGVLAHEAGHVIQRHAAQQMAKSELGQILVTATGVGMSDQSGQGGYEAAMVAGLVNQMTQLHYGRKDELEADAWGLLLMSEAGYTPNAMLQVMEILEKSSSGGHEPEMLLTHPYPETRIKHIKEYLKNHPEYERR